MNDDVLKPLIARAVVGPLSREEAEQAFEALFEGHGTSAQIAGLLMAMRTRGESVDEYAAAAHVMRQKCLSVQAPEGSIDIVGTGGDGKGTLNISTATAFVVAGADVSVAKHGNRNLSSKSGAADALGAMGIDVMLPPKAVEVCLQKIGICFMMAPIHHPAIRHVMPVRKELATRTIFNILGPLTNPAGVKHQLTGAFSPSLLWPMAETLRALGSQKAWLVHGGDGTDELSISDTSQVVELNGDELRAFTLHPEDADLPVHPFTAIMGGEPTENAKAFRNLLLGEQSAYRDAVLLNSAAALMIANKAATLKEGVEIARCSIDSKAALGKIDALVKLTHKLAQNEKQ